MTDPILERIKSTDGNWGLMSFNKDAHYYSKVAMIHFIAHTDTDPTQSGADGQLPTNHWSMFLEISPKLSVHIDATPNSPGEAGMIVVESTNCCFTEEHTHVVSMIPASNTTVRSVLGVICQYNRDQYIFAPIGEGCRFWMFTVANDFAVEGLITQSDADKVRDAVHYYWPYPKGTAGRPRPIAVGQFF